MTDTERMVFQSQAVAADAARYRWLRDQLQRAVGGNIGNVTVDRGDGEDDIGIAAQTFEIQINDNALVYEPVEPKAAVEIRWYPNTPVGFNQLLAPTLDEAIDEGMREFPIET